jgi:hypothetical protein
MYLNLVLVLSISRIAFSFNLGYEQSNGRTRLFGTSFGIFGQNAKFDYIVSASVLITGLANGMTVGYWRWNSW